MKLKTLLFSVIGMAFLCGIAKAAQPSSYIQALEESLTQLKRNGEILRAISFVQTMQIIKHMKKFPDAVAAYYAQQVQQRLHDLIELINFPHDLIIEKAFESNDRDIIHQAFTILLDLHHKRRYTVSLFVFDRAIEFDDPSIVHQILYLPAGFNETFIQNAYQLRVKEKSSSAVQAIFERRLGEFEQLRAQNLLAEQKRAHEAHLQSQVIAHQLEAQNAAKSPVICSRVKPHAKGKMPSDLNPKAKPFMPKLIDVKAVSPEAVTADKQKRSRYAFAQDN